MLEIKKFEIDDKFPDYRPSKEETIKKGFVETRFTEMQQNRTIVEKDWDVYQTMIDAIFTPYPDERSSSVVPLASAMIELYVAEAMKLQTEYKFR